MRRWMVTVLAVAVAGFCADAVAQAAPKSARDADKAIEKGCAGWSDGGDGYIAACTKALGENPIGSKDKRSDALRWLGHAYYAKQDFDRALAAYDQQVRIEGKVKDNGRLFTERGTIFAIKGDVTKAVADFTAGIGGVTFWGEDQFESRARAYLMKGDFERAVADWNRLLKENKDKSGCYAPRAEVRARAGKLDEALNEADCEIRGDADNRLAHAVRALVLASKGRLAEAEAAIGKVKADESDFLDVVYRGEVKLMKGDTRLALADFEAVLATMPKRSTYIGNEGRDALYRHYARVGKEKALRAIAAGLAVAASVPSTPPAVVPVEQLSEECKRSLGDAAISACTKVLNASASAADRAKAFEMRGLAYLLKSELDMAIADLGEAVRLDAGLTSAYSTRAQALLSKQDFSAAIADLDTVVQRTPKDAQAVGIRGLALFFAGNVQRGFQDLDESVRLDPTADAYSLRSYIRADADDADGALKDIEAAMSLGFKKPEAYSLRAFIQAKKGDFTRSDADLAEAFRMEPENEFAGMIEGEIRLVKGDLQAALAAFDKSLARSPEGNPFARLGREKTMRAIAARPGAATASTSVASTTSPQSSASSNGDFEQCEKFDGDACARVIARGTEPAERRAKAHFMRATYTSKTAEDAIADFSEAIRLGYNDPYVFWYRGEAFSGKGEFAAAIQDFDKAAAFPAAQVSSRIYDARAYARAQSGDLNAALADSARGVSSAPTNATAHAISAVVLAKRGDGVAADAAMAEALRLAPNDIDVVSCRGDMKLAKGDAAGALADFDTVLADRPNQAFAKRGREAAVRALAGTKAVDLVASVVAPPPIAIAPIPAIPPAPKVHRVALVIGNGAYASVARLPNPSRDAKAVAGMFRAAGFDSVDIATDASVAAMKKALRDFSERALDADMAVVFFAGHGIEVGGRNFLVPVDAKLARDIDVEDETVPLDRVLQLMDSVKQLKLVILDACRDNPFAASMRRTTASRSIGRGLARPDTADSDVLIAYAASPNAIAADGDGANSPFTTALLRYLTKPGLDIRQALGAVRDDVRAATNRSQQPFISGSLGGGLLTLVPLGRDAKQ